MPEVVDTYTWTARVALMEDARNADQAELEAMRQSVVATAVSMHDERLAEELETEDVGLSRLEEQIASDVQLEALSGRLLEELERRADLLGQFYPFSIDNGSLIYEPSRTKAYEFCLAISTAPNLTVGPLTELARYFEVFAGDAVCRFLGEGSSYVRSGFPPYPADNAIRSLKDAIEHVHAATGEWEWSPSDDSSGDLGRIKDEGLDFVVWKSLDRRKGKLYVLGQCACGLTDWHAKYDDLNLSRLQRWVPRINQIYPLKAFATPHNVTASRVFAELSKLAGLSFDRIRLTLIANSEKDVEHFVTEHTPKLSELIELVQ